MDNVIGLLTANYATPELAELTNQRTSATLPFGGRYRLVDFALSNMVNAGIRSVGVIMPYSSSIIDHVGAGGDWDLDRKNGGVFFLTGSVYGISNAHSGARFALRDIGRNLVYLMRSPAPYVIVAASNTVYNMDYMDLVQAHIDSGADITMAYHYAAEDDGDVTGLKIENDRVRGITNGVKRGDAAFLDCFVVGRNQLLNIVDWYSAIDYLDIFQVLSEDYNKMYVGVYRFDGYAKSIFSVQSYARRSMDLLRREVREALFPPNAPIVTKIADAPPAKYTTRAKVKNAIIPAGCVIDGTVEQSILFRGVRVGRGAVVRNSVIMQSCVIEDGARVENAVIDRNNLISAGTVICGTPERMYVMGKGKGFAMEAPGKD